MSFAASFAVLVPAQFDIFCLHLPHAQALPMLATWICVLSASASRLKHGYKLAPFTVWLLVLAQCPWCHGCKTWCGHVAPRPDGLSCSHIIWAIGPDQTAFSALLSYISAIGHMHQHRSRGPDRDAGMSL